MKKSLLFLLIAMGIFVSGCASEDKEALQTSVASEETEKDKSPAEEKENKEKEEETFDFAELKNQEFFFSSGAGAWSTELMVDEDGNFSGTYSDTDMGDSGEGYPNGTRYYCEFEGKFSKAVKVNDYTYSMEIEKISLANDAGTSEIKDGVLYSYSTPYGISEAEELLIYLPGAPVDELPAEYVSWVQMSIPDDNDEELPFYGLYNVAEQNGFLSYDVMERLDDYIESAREQSEKIEDYLQNDAMTQMDMNMKSQELYEVWDDALNCVWDNAKNMLKEDEFAELTNKQLKWIEEKEKAAKEAGKDFEGGSMYPLIVNTKAAELTEERVYELYEMLK